MKVSQLKAWFSDNDLAILINLGFIAWVIYDLRSEGTSWLAIAFGIPMAGILGLIGIVLIGFLISYLFGSTPEVPPIDYWGDGKQAINVDFSSPLNRGVLEFIRKVRRSRNSGLESASPASVKKPLTKTGTHPNVGVRLWDGLAVSLPVDCRWIVCGVPALVHPQTGVLFGVGIGFMYYLRLSDADMERAVQAGAHTEIIQSDGSTLDLASQFGSGWVVGSWLQEEFEWCRAAYEALGQTAAGKAGYPGADSVDRHIETPHRDPMNTSE